MATAVPLPNLSLISFITASQTSCLRDEITTLAPCSAMRSAMARPMPRVEPVMTATFPDMSNKVMRFLPNIGPAADAPVFVSIQASGEFAGGGGLRSSRLMHRVLRGNGNPRLLVDHPNAPPAKACACETIE